MSNFDALRARVEEAAETLASAEAERHRQNESLAGLLGQLESRFDAQRRELEFYKARVEPLEAINEQLAGLMDRLLAMIDNGFGEASVVPLREAAAHAARILEEEMGEAPTVAEPEAPAFVMADEARAPSDEAAAGTENDARFDNVGMAELVAESDVEDEESISLPDIVAEACRSATGEDTADSDLIAEVMEAISGVGDSLEGVGGREAVEALAEQLAAGNETLEGMKDGAPNIRALLARVEAAVEEVRTCVEPQEDGQATDPAEARSAVA